MGSNSSKAPIKYTGGVRDKKSGQIKRFEDPKDAYNDLYKDVHAKFNGHSSWVKPEMTLYAYISKFAPKEDSNDPESYTGNMVRAINLSLKTKNSSSLINKDSTLADIKNKLMAAGLDPDHEITKAHLRTEDPKVLSSLHI